MKALEAALYTKLSGDATLMALLPGGVHNVFQHNPTYPWLVFEKVSGTPDYTLAQRVNTAYLYQVRVIGRGPDKDTLSDALSRVDVLLNDATLTITGHTLMYCRKDADLPDMPLMDGATVYVQVGATYRIEVA